MDHISFVITDPEIAMCIQRDATRVRFYAYFSGSVIQIFLSAFLANRLPVPRPWRGKCRIYMDKVAVYKRMRFETFTRRTCENNGYDWWLALVRARQVKTMVPPMPLDYRVVPIGRT